MQGVGRKVDLIICDDYEAEDYDPALIHNQEREVIPKHRPHKKINEVEYSSYKEAKKNLKARKQANTRKKRLAALKR